MSWTGVLQQILSGQKVTGTKLGGWYSSLLAQSDLWQDYSGSVGWTSAGTAPVLNNGNMIATFIQNGKFVACRGRITMGTTTTFGSANAWQMNFPVTMAAAVAGTGVCAFLSSATATKTPGSLLFANQTTCNFASIGGPCASTVPFTWASGNYLSWFYCGEAA